MEKKTAVLSAGAVLALALILGPNHEVRASAPRAQAASAAAPNILFILTDDQDENLGNQRLTAPATCVSTDDDQSGSVECARLLPGAFFGTSFSAAYVSGVAALMLERAPGLTPDGVRKILQDTAKDLGPKGKDPEFGAGLVDAYQAILAAQPNVSAGQGAPQPRLTTQ